nr:MMPL family transporter [Micromonospora foliorum]
MAPGAVSLLCLLLSSLNSPRALGPVAAIGIAATVLVMLTFLPARLVLGGHGAQPTGAPGGRGRGDRRAQRAGSRVLTEGDDQ